MLIEALVVCSHISNYLLEDQKDCLDHDIFGRSGRGGSPFCGPSLLLAIPWSFLNKRGLLAPSLHGVLSQGNSQLNPQVR